MGFDEFCEKGILIGKMRYHKYRHHGFKTPSGKFEIFSTTLESMGIPPLPVYREPPISPISSSEISKDYPLILTSSGKVREFFHSEGRQIASLRKANPDPIIEVHPDTARLLSVSNDDWVWIETPEGRVQMRTIHNVIINWT